MKEHMAISGEQIKVFFFGSAARWDGMHQRGEWFPKRLWC
jgi:hypothetical protein